jgi:hypothetical protein
MVSTSARRQIRLGLCGLSSAFAIAVNVVVAGQSPAGAPSEKNMFIETPAGWRAPKTAWGDPDLQGTWPISYVGGVPLERCAGGGGRAGEPAPPCDPNKAFLTEEEFKARVAAIRGRGDRYADAIKAGNFGGAFQAGVVDPTSPQRQTSLIVDPPNGKLPAMTEEGKRLSSQMRSSWAAYPDEVLTFDSELDFDTWDRCITRGMPASMFPFRYNNGVQILQTPGYVVLNMEMIHEARIIPVGSTSGPKPSPKVKEWLGISRGRWEGNTLVIETTNFKPGASATNIGVVGAPQGNRFPTSEKMKITERITRMNDTMLLYEITTEDPVVITRPWTARFPLKLDNNYKWWEYACLEGNRTIPDYISASRAERAAAGKEAPKD